MGSRLQRAPDSVHQDRDAEGLGDMIEGSELKGAQHLGLPIALV